MHHVFADRRWNWDDEPEIENLLDEDEDPVEARLRELRERGERRERSRQREQKRGFANPRERTRPYRETFETY